MDISNGPGVRVSIFMQGCAFNCKNCFNPETHDFKGGKEFTDDTIKRVLDLCDNENVEGLSILGGEPLYKDTIDAAIKLCKAFKERYQDKNIWLWTGFTWETIENKEILEYLEDYSKYEQNEVLVKNLKEEIIATLDTNEVERKTIEVLKNNMEKFTTKKITLKYKCFFWRKCSRKNEYN